MWGMISDSFRKDRTIQDVPVLTQEALDRHTEAFLAGGGSIQAIAIGEVSDYEHPMVKMNREYSERGQKASLGKAGRKSRREVGY